MCKKLIFWVPFPSGLLCFCRIAGLIVLVLGFCLTSSVHAANIVWVAGAHDDNGDGAPDDQAWVDLLEAQGHSVDFQRGYWTTLDASKIDALNDAGLVIVSRCSGSGDYDDGDEPTQWNSITTPLILQSVYLVRSSRWLWFNTDSLTGDGGAPTLEAVEAGHPVFNGVTLDANNQVDILDGAVGPTSFVNSTDVGNGKLLAKVVGEEQAFIVEWDAGVEFYHGSGQIAGGPRMLFTTGTQENGGVGRGEYNITPEGEKMFLNAVSYMLPKIATNPTPADGGIYEDTWANLSWSPGALAVSHDVYVGDNFDDVNDGAEGTFQGNQSITSLLVGFLGFPFPDGLLTGTTYYWRIDEVEADGTTIYKGSVWSFTVPPKTAYDPDPPDGVEFVALDVTLNWTAGFGAKLHYMYFGDNFDDVNSAVVGIPQVTTTYTPGPLVKDTFYYWRVDEFDGVTTHKGDVWSFRTIPIVAITNPNLKGWWKFDEGPGSTAVDWSGHDNHGSLYGTALSWMPDDGMIGGALSFDGTKSDTDYVEISAADISITAGTIAMWAKLRPNPQAPDTRYFCGHTTIPAWNDRIQLYMDNSDTMLDLGLGDSHARQTDIMSLTTDTWYHVALTWDGGNYVVYVNGEEKANGSYTGLETLNTVADIGNDGNPGDRTEAFNGLLDNVRIYDYALSQAEIPLAMRGDPLIAWGPSPTPGSTPYIRDATPLNWSPGDNASGHDVYFGTNRNAVADANASDTTGIYQGRQGVTIYTPSEGVEWGGGPYYWRIDEYNTDATISKGNVWSFTVTDFILIEDFEDYNDYEPDRIYETWIDGWGTTTNGSTAGYPDPNFNQGEHFVETNIVHGGGQSMPLFYENNFKYSEATLTLVSPRDWTEEGVGVLSLWFYGDTANAAERMYVALNGSAVVYHDDPSAAQIDEWTEWTIDLQEFAAQGVNLANVNTISIGFGDKNNLQPGGSGMVFFDDIRLYRPAP